MNHDRSVIRQSIKTPRAAAIAGILSSILLITSMLLIWSSVPADPLGPLEDVVRNSRKIDLALNLLSFAGIAFLWFIAVLRDRLGDLEDRFFATVFLGSGLVFIAMTFAAAIISGGLMTVLTSGSGDLIRSGAWALGRVQVSVAIHTYAFRMAGVFMISASTLSARTSIFPRWMTFLGFALALVLLVGMGTISWIPLVFPLWVLLVSVHILIQNFRPDSRIERTDTRSDPA